jgi:AcrR family transcriptional regulator
MQAVTPVRRSRRNPQRSQERILAAALDEFATQGFAGARVDVIARRAAINKRMLYHYFSDKRGLFRAVVRRKMAERAAWLAAAPDDPREMLPYWFELACRDRDWIRLLEWEALQLGENDLIHQAQRRAAYQRAVAKIRQGQRQGRLSKAFDPRHILLSMMALTAYPLAFPQLTRLVTGLSATDPEFQRQRAAFLQQFAAAFRTQKPSSAARRLPGKTGSPHRRPL